MESLRVEAIDQLADTQVSLVALAQDKYRKQPTAENVMNIAVAVDKLTSLLDLTRRSSHE